MADEGLRPEDAARIADAVEYIEQTVDRFRSAQTPSAAAYGAEKHVGP